MHEPALDQYILHVSRPHSGSSVVNYTIITLAVAICIAELHCLPHIGSQKHFSCSVIT